MYSLGNNWRIWTRVEQGWNRSGIRLAGCRVTGKSDSVARVKGWRRASRRMPRGCTRHLSTRRAVSGPDLHGVPRWIVRVSRRDHGRQSWPFSLGSGNIKPHTSSASDQRTDLSRRRVPLPLSLSLSLCPSFCLSLYVLWFTSGGGRLPRSQSKGNPERSHDNVGSRSPRLIPAPDGNVLSSPRSRGCIFYRLPDVTLMDPRRYAIVARSTIARRESVWESCVNFSEEKLLFFSKSLKISKKLRESDLKVIWNLALVNFLEQQFSTVIRIDEYIRRSLAAVISWINNVTSRTLINRLGRRVCVCKLGRVRRRDAGQYYYEDKRTDAIYHQGLPASAPWHPALGEYSSGWERRSIVNFCELRSAAGGTCQTDDFIFRTS